MTLALVIIGVATILATIFAPALTRIVGAGFNPEQAVDLWENMMAASAGRSPQWLSTHPDPQSRIQELGKRATTLAPVYQQARAAGRVPKCA